MGRNLVICMDGTGNTIRARGNTNILRLFGMLENSDEQLTFYSPGVGTQSDPNAVTPLMRRLSMLRGQITGHGMRGDLADAYTFLIDNYRPGDNIFLFGFSRGAFAALSVAGMTRLLGLPRAGSSNMIGRTVRRYTNPIRNDQDVDKDLWRTLFARHANDDDREWWAPPVAFVGLFDTVRATKYFQFWTRLREDGWAGRYHESNPYTHRPEPTVRIIRHAVSLHEKRIPYDVFRIRPANTDAGNGPHTDFREVWFAGVHSDVGGGFDCEELDEGEVISTHGLGRVTLKWMVEEAVASGLKVEDGAYARLCADPAATQKPHSNGVFWLLFGLRPRYRRRASQRRAPEGAASEGDVRHADEQLLTHSSVFENPAWGRDRTVDGLDLVYVDKEWQESRPDGYRDVKGVMRVVPAPPRSRRARNFAISLLVWIAVTSLLWSTVVGLASQSWEDFVQALPALLMGPIGLRGAGTLGLGLAPSLAFFVGGLMTTFFWVMFVATLVGMVVAPADADKEQPDKEPCGPSTDG